MIGLNRIFAILLFAVLMVNGQSQKVGGNLLDNTAKSIPQLSFADTTFVTPDIPAEFMGGAAALQKFTSNNLEYPKEVIELGIKGKVVAEFVVEPTGELSHIKIIKSLHKECDKEVMRITQKMPNWTPAKKDNKPVRSVCTIPVYFNFY